MAATQPGERQRIGVIGKKTRDFAVARRIAEPT